MIRYRDLLQNTLKRRLAANSRYSLRAFARDLGLSPAFLSQVMSGKRGLTLKTAPEVLKRIGVTREESQLYLLEVEREHLRSDARKATLQQKINVVIQNSKAVILQGEAFARMSDWYAMAILQLMRLKTSPRKSKAEWIKWASVELAVPTSDLKRTISELTSLGLLREEARGWTVVHDTMWTTDGVPNPAIRTFHHQMINKAKAAIEGQSIQERFLHSMQMPIQKSDLENLQRDVLKFRNQMLRKYGRTEQCDGDRVYALTMQLFKLTK